MSPDPRRARILIQTVSAIHSFYLAMTMHPEAQLKAQAEIDRVIESDRFPKLADQPNLPYVDALVKEVLRWNPVTPLGKSAVLRSHRVPFPFVPREANYGGLTRNPTHHYRERRLRGVFHSQGILGGREHLVSRRTEGTSSSKSFLNMFPPVAEIRSNRQILHDPNAYANPMEFNPERFLGDRPEPEPRSTTFGFGRRTCECCFFLIIHPLVALYPCFVDSTVKDDGLGLYFDFMTLSLHASSAPLQTTETTGPLYLLVICWTGPGLTLAQSSLWLACAMSLAVFGIKKFIDEFGNVVEPKIHCTDGTIR